MSDLTILALDVATTPVEVGMRKVERYHGSACKRCGGTERRKSNGSCVKCDSARAWAHSVKYREIYNAKIAKRRRDNPEHEIYSNAKVRAKKLKLVFTLKPADIYIPKLCPVLRIPLFWGLSRKGPTDNSPTLDRLDNNQGYTTQNTAIMSYRANRIKSDATIHELDMIIKYMKAMQS